MIHLETERLRFRQWTEADFPAFADFFAKADNARYLGGTKSREESWRLMATYIGHYHLKGYGYMALEEKATAKLVGTVGLFKSIPWPEVELGYWLLPEMQGKGFALEAARKVIDYAYQELKLKTLVSYIDSDNLPSIMLAERLGGSYDQDIELLEFGPHRVYRYDKEKPLLKWLTLISII